MTLGSHQRSIGLSQTHLTPREILDPLGPFDLDPCAADPRPWDCAARNIVESQDGLAQPWTGRVWLNPPFDRRQIAKWVSRMAAHGSGTLLVHARTETEWFAGVWANASALLFLDRRITFRKPDGSPCATANGKAANSGAPVVLAAFGDRDASILANSKLGGALVWGWRHK